MPTALFASGAGTNVQAVLDVVRTGELPLDVRIVISNAAGAGALDRARKAGVESVHAPFMRGADSRAEYTKRVAALARGAGARLVLLLGWMVVLSPDFLDAGFEGVLNLHPAWLPDDPSADDVVLPDGSRSPCFRGPRALRDALAAGATMTGATLHQITADVDRGPVLARAPLALHAGESEAQALERMHAVERDVVKAGVLRWLRERSERLPA